MFNKTLGILGGGQLGRMSAMAAARLGIRTVILTPEEHSPASQVADETIVARYEEHAALKELAKKCDVVSYEFENIPVESIRFLQKHVEVYPDDKLLDIAQDRIKEKQFLNDIGIETARWAAVNSGDDILPVLQEWGVHQGILKTTRFGYDGKGQRLYKKGEDIYEACARLGAKQPLIIEDVVPFSCELSVIIARDKMGQTAFYGPSLNEHKNHILHKSTVPAPVPENVAEKARNMAERLAEAVDLVGVLALELFLTEDNRLLANEIAPRTHNSGHWTIDACAVSQFENHVRTVCGLHVGVPGRHSDAIMRNLIGDDVKDSPKFLEAPHTCLHLYGKSEIRPGRKMGHVNVLKTINY